MIKDPNIRTRQVLAAWAPRAAAAMLLRLAGQSIYEACRILSNATILTSEGPNEDAAKAREYGELLGDARVIEAAIDTLLGKIDEAMERSS